MLKEQLSHLNICSYDNFTWSNLVIIYFHHGMSLIYMQLINSELDEGRQQSSSAVTSITLRWQRVSLPKRSQADRLLREGNSGSEKQQCK